MEPMSRWLYHVLDLDQYEQRWFAKSPGSIVFKCKDLMGKKGALLTYPLQSIWIVNTASCVFDWMKALYDQGARNFLLKTMMSLHLAPIYATDGYPTKFWSEPHIQIEWSILMAELVHFGNELWALRTTH
ncbi:unnamed protein product [Rhizoctonia solani]|uniref:Uncharacterized protein n=1 Tax=Rhizoctonia solani TaxID=456999 RepID=A0A8H3A372_9AGAM|nr:unnamed protein product [Rhizoctonia solani]